MLANEPEGTTFPPLLTLISPCRNPPTLTSRHKLMGAANGEGGRDVTAGDAPAGGDRIYDRITFILSFLALLAGIVLTIVTLRSGRG